MAEAEYMQSVGRKLPTGIDSIDRQLGGGIEAGSLVSFLTPPAAQSHSILEQLMKERPTTYITTLRSRRAIQHDLQHYSSDEIEISIYEVGEACTEMSNKMEQLVGSEIHRLNTIDRETTLDDIDEIVKSVDTSVNIIIDPVNPLERSDSRVAYQNLLKNLKSKILETDSLCILHSTRLESPPPFRETSLTMSDVVWELDVVSGRKDNLEIQTRIPKNRGGDAVLEKVTLVVYGTEVYTDDSRNI